MKASDRGRNVKFLGNNFGCVLSKLSNNKVVLFQIMLDGAEPHDAGTT